jgi:S1-C subfamily serine protease
MNPRPSFFQTSTLLGLLALSLVLATCASCATGIQQRNVVRPASDQKTAAINAREVLTAAHVVSCNVETEVEDPITKTKKKITVSFGTVDSLFGVQPDGISRPLKVQFMSEGTDIARLSFADAGEWYGVQPAKIAPVRIESRVCIVVAAPRRDRRCGEVEDILTTNANDVTLSTPVEPGNSGSAVYDRDGRLVGIVTQRRGLKNGQSTGGIATALGGREWVTFARVVTVP